MRKMRVLALTRYGPLAPSSRVRFYQYVPYLKQHGVEFQMAPLLPNDYVERLYSGKRSSLISISAAYYHRIKQLTQIRKFDLLWLEKELLPWLPALAERMLARLKIPYVVDYDDAVFHRYDLHKNGLIRLFLGKKIDSVMRNAALVIVGNDYLAERAHKAGARKVEFLPSVVDTQRFFPKEKNASDFHVGWIGSPITAPYLRLIEKPLNQLCRNPDVHVILVGAGYQDHLPGIRKEMRAWDEATETSEIHGFDLGIMPLPDEPFERGKCGYKLIQYMACGLPVVASPVGKNKEIVEHGVNGFWASTEAEWLSALSIMRADKKKRILMGAAGRKKVEHEYSLKVTAPRLLDLLLSAKPIR
jgi:glycosyltransferase involved in cell wall biosynthesis